MRTFSFNGASSDGVFKTNAIRRQLIAPIASDVKTIRGKGGGIAQKSYLEVRQIEVDVTLMRQDNVDLRSFVESIVIPWLYTEDDKKIIFSDEPTRIYYGKLIGDTNIEDMLGMGEVTLTFLCADPFKYRSIEQSILFTSPSVGATTVFNNTGTAPTYPKIRVVPTGAITWVKFTNQTTGKFVLLHNIGGVLDAWKVVIVDTALNKVYDDANGTRRDNILDLSSDYFPLVKGNNTLLMETNVSPATSAPMSARLIFTERYY
jgi:predicted phage tail component-like protein